MKHPEYYLGVMTGTSLDGLDIVLADLQEPRPRIEASAAVAFEPALREARSPGAAPDQRLAPTGLADAADAPSPPEDGASAGRAWRPATHAPAYAPVPSHKSATPTAQRHRHRCGLRRRDVPPGQGTVVPVPRACAREHPGALNIGGMANLTLLAGDAAEITGFDTGPGNTLLDQWHKKHQGAPMDRNGAWGASGKVQPALLEAFLTDPFFQRAPPKSTGREMFNLPWLERFSPDRWPPADVQATLGALTAASVADALERFCLPDSEDALASRRWPS